MAPRRSSPERGPAPPGHLPLEEGQMSGQPWRRYVATTCAEAWDLDARATDEVMRCIEDMIAQDGITDSATVQVFLSVGPSEIGARQSAITVRIQVSA